ncbi:MAG: BA14K family protein [Hyphomicrobiales bacterium]|nr:BA14K family protein [Hyphomicrobiales bacterium]
MTGLILPALLALATGGFANAPAADPQRAPIAETVQFRGGNWRDHPLMYRGNWDYHNWQWDAREGRAFEKGPRCTRFRSYDPTTRTFVDRNGRRVRCR